MKTPHFHGSPGDGFNAKPNLCDCAHCENRPFDKNPTRCNRQGGISNPNHPYNIHPELDPWAYRTAPITTEKVHVDGTEIEIYVQEPGCGHGECTSRDTLCRYEPSNPPTVRWSAADLDRCEHGRHSIDPCFDCPGGHSTGNLFLIRGDRRELRSSGERTVEVRIGTTHGGDPIWVLARRENR